MPAARPPARPAARRARRTASPVTRAASAARPSPVPAGIKKTALRRRTFIEEKAGPAGQVLEIGAFDNPTFRREAGDRVRYLDYFSAEELRAAHAGNARRDLAATVAVDYVVKSNDFAAVVGGPYDLVVANHVVEHIPDLVHWFAQLAGLLAEGGRIFLAVPDRRYTFDYFRRESTALQVLRAHRARLDRPDPWQRAEHLYYHQRVDLAALWAGQRPPAFAPRFSLAEALGRAEAQAGEYVDCHCWVFTPPSFRALIRDLRSAGALDLAVEHMEGPREGTNEFWVLLRRA
jgi:SAM-dependent methyltransferase